MRNHSPNQSSRQLYARVLAVKDISQSVRRQMLGIMCRYYEHVDWAQFNLDLDQKNHVIMMYEKFNNQLRGFSTIKILEMKAGSKTIMCAFSGDTVVEKAFWGQRVLGRAFLWYLLKVKLTHPMRPLYWLLISKGYKTYLLMANNIRKHYPRFEEATPSNVGRIMSEAYRTLFPETYDEATNTLMFKGPSCRIKDGLVDPDPSLLNENPRVRFFESVNPDWRKGVELCCIARITLFLPFYYQLKSFYKLGMKSWRRVETYISRETISNEI